MPQVCLYKETRRSKACGEKLWTTRITKGGPRVVPCRLYSTQDFESWLEFFLCCPGIEELIDKSYTHRPSHVTMESIWDSPAWQSLGPFTTTRGNLTFSYFIDWLNPYTNKIAGKSASCGAIMMFCLNLPFELQRLPQFTFFAGITPPPKEPTVTSITALADPIVDRLEVMWKGKVIRTYRHPKGLFTRVGVLAAIGDLMAMRKALGFAGISSYNFCSFCTLQLPDIDNLDCQSWAVRVGDDVLKASKKWREAITKKKRHELFQKNGVRWSSLHRLTYRDPVRHTVLGVMHNWLEGILQHHARVLWGIGTIPVTQTQRDSDSDEKGLATPPVSPCMSDELEMDVDKLDEELNAILEESRKHQDRPRHLTRFHSTLDLLDVNKQSDSDQDDDDFRPIDEDSEDEGEGSDEDEGEEEEDTWTASCIFDKASLLTIRQCLADTVIPSWLERPPVNLGDKSHGKLKADQWLTLFSVFLPLILPELWESLKPGPHEGALLENFHDLVTCTNIVCSYTTTPASADLYTDHYIQYRKTCKQLFPKVKTRPNHHYAMHNGDLLKYWGPLIKLSEFPYEQHNGQFQKVKTNSHACTSKLSLSIKKLS